MLPLSFDATTVPVPSPEKAECVKYCVRSTRESPHSEGGDCLSFFLSLIEVRKPEFKRVFFARSESEAVFVCVSAVFGCCAAHSVC